MQMRMAATLPSSASWAARLAMFSEQVLHHARRAVARARRPAGRISALAFPKLGHSPHSSAGFGVWGAGRRRPENACVWGPRRRGPKNPRRFWGAPRPRNEKPGAVSRAGLGHTPEGYLFMHESRFNVQKSQVAEPTSCTGVTSAPRTGCIRHPKKYLLGTPACWRPSNEKLGTVSRSGLDTLSSVLESRYNPYSPEVVNFLVFSTKGASPLSDLRLLRKQGAEPAFKIGPRTCCLRRCRVASDLEGATLLFAEPDSSHRAGGF
jgi:hypothetical protein